LAHTEGDNEQRDDQGDPGDKTFHASGG
jgi:hypothetical protein